MKKITVSILTTLLMLSMVFSSSVFAANEETSAWDSFLGLFSAKASADDVGVEYRGHVQNKGDFPTNGSWIQGPNQLGTVGESLRLEAFWIKLTDAPEGLHIKYEVHVQNRGWMAPVEDGALAGTQAESLRIEAIKISLVDDEGVASKDYSVSYKGHVQNIGDTAWYEDGAQLGTTGSNLRLEALEVKIEKIPSDLEAYEAALAAVTEANYTKASWATYQDVVEANVMTEDNVQSEVDAATAAITEAQDDLVTKAVVTSATAATQNTITLQGAALEKLAVADITVKNITVSSVVASADGTSATVTLASDLLADTDTAVAVVSDGDTSNFTVKFSIQTQVLAAVGGLFDQSLKNQKVAITLNGTPVTPDYLQANGYTVEFRAWNAAGTIANTALFNTGSDAVSTTGIINEGTTTTPVAQGKYTVQATARKGSVILTSEKVTVEIVDLVNSASQILSYEMTQNTGGKIMNSSTLVATETTTINNVVVQFSATNTMNLVAGEFSLETSNKNVIAVGGTNGNEITAVAPGTADITIKVGAVTKKVTFTVTLNPRVPSTVSASSAQVAAIMDDTNAISASTTVTVLDQYGDPVVITPASNLFVTTTPSTYATIKYAVTGAISGLTVTPTVTTGTDAAKGKYSVALAATNVTNGQISTIAFTNKAGTNVGSFTVKTNDDNAGITYKAEYTAASKNKTNSLNTNMVDMEEINLQVNVYNKSGVKVSTVADLADYTVLYDSNMVTVAGYDSSGALVSPDANSTAGTFIAGGSTTAYIKITPVSNAKGNTPISIYTTSEQKTRIDNRTLSVNAATPKITAVTLKSAIARIGDVTWKDALSYTERVDKDPIISGLTLSEATGYDVCIDLTDATTIYVDRDRDGALTTGEEIGTLEFTIHNNGTTNLITMANNVVSIPANADGSFTYTVWDTTPTNTPKVVVDSKTVIVDLTTKAATLDAAAVEATDVVEAE